jgi:putative endonuclease
LAYYPAPDDAIVTADQTAGGVVQLGFGKRKAAHLRLGQRGERIAARLLRELGLDVLTRNYGGEKGEIDLVVRDGTTLCFVEVKTRHHRVNSRPADAVGHAKRQRIVRTAHQYLRELGFPKIVYRFDIVEVILVGPRITDVRYWRNAFQEEQHDAATRFPSALGE